MVSNGLVNAALVSLLVLHWHPCLHPAGSITSTCAVVFTATAGLAWASLPLLRWTHHPHGTRVVVSIANWRPPRHNAIVTPQRMWRRHCVIVVVCGICGRNRRRSLATWLLCRANLALVVLPLLHRSLPRLRWRLCKHCTVDASVVLTLSPTLPWPLCPHCSGIAPILAN